MRGDERRRVEGRRGEGGEVGYEREVRGGEERRGEERKKVE